MQLFRTRFSGAYGAIAVALFCGVAGAQSLTQPVSPEEIVKALEPAATRSLSVKPTMSATADGDEAFIHSLAKKSSRSLSVADRKKLEDIADKKPAIDLTMEFPYNSSTLRGEALETAHNLGKALTTPQMKGKTFMLAGHTDAKGSDASNQTLSERRANAVKRFLVTTYRIPPETLITVGYGKSRLKNADQPTAAENRRVQTVNMLPYASASQ